MDYIHCNKCFATCGNNREFNVSNCGHVLCRECLERGPPHSKEQCLICHLACKFVKISENDSQEMQCFCDIDAYFRRGACFLAFQLKQRYSLIEHNSKLSAEIKRMQRDLKEVVNQNKKRKKALEQTQAEVQHLRGRLKIRTGLNMPSDFTPNTSKSNLNLSTGFNNSRFNNSLLSSASSGLSGLDSRNRNPFAYVAPVRTTPCSTKQFGKSDRAPATSVSPIHRNRPFSSNQYNR